MKHALIALGTTILVAGLMGLGWFKYKDFLTRGMRPTQSTLKLNRLEAEGIPHFEMDDINGRPIKLEDFKDKVVIVNFWASWCGPCVQEFPSMIRLLKRFPKDVVLLALSHDKNWDELKGFIDVFQVQKLSNFIVLWDKDHRLAKEFGTEVLPESYILTPGLKLERKVVGVEEWDQPLAVEYFESLIKTPNL